MPLTSLIAVARKTVLATLLAGIMPLAAFAADLPLPPIVTKAPPASRPYDWSGFYLGGQFGYLWGRAHVDEDDATAEHHARTDGIVAGMLLGYNWQVERLVFGLEGDFGWSNAHGVGSIIINVPVTTHGPNTYDVRWISHARGRIGYAFDNTLVYVAGGFVASDLDFREGAITTTIVQTVSNNGGKYYGWSVGAGIEQALTRNLVGRVEYLYDDFGHKDYIGVLGDHYRVSLTGSTVRGVLAYKFDPLGR